MIRSLPSLIAYVILCISFRVPPSTAFGGSLLTSRIHSSRSLVVSSPSSPSSPSFQLINSPQDAHTPSMLILSSSATDKDVITTAEDDNDLDSEGNDNDNDIDSDNDNNDHDDKDTNSKASNTEIVVNASIDLPFAADVAFDVFSDLPRQPSWSSWLHSVSYIDDNYSKNDDNIAAIIAQEEREKRKTYFLDDKSDFIDVEKLRHTKWVMGWKKIRFSWKSKVTSMERPKCIQWESTSGLKNMGMITFEEQEDNTGNSSVLNTKMTLTLKFITPRIVARLTKRSDKVATFMKTQILRPTLRKFRDIVIVDDLGRVLEANEK
jgi:uncharacterized membrane protein